MTRRKSDTDLQVEERIRAHVRQQLHERGKSKAWLSKETGYDDSAVSRLLSGARGSLRPGVIVKLAEVLEVNPSRLLKDDPPRQFFQRGSEESSGRDSE